jgi:dihydroorotase
MSKTYHIANAFIVNEGKICKGDVIIQNGIIDTIDFSNNLSTPADAEYMNAEGLWLLPGIIDDQVHFREPGLTEKADIAHESKAAVAGGVTSFMDMPNTKPPAVTLQILEDKYNIAAKSSLANYSFYMGVTNDNIEEVLNTPLNSVCGLKVFLGSSTGNLLVNDQNALENLFAKTQHIVTVHCEEDSIIQNNLEKCKELFGENIPFNKHHEIRNVDACYTSSAKAIALARKHNTRLHVLHISTADELSLFDKNIPLNEKRITAEVCVHHLWFSANDYNDKGALIKWNPAIKEEHHRDSLRKAIYDNTIDVVATDHAPHLLEEKNKNYSNSPSGAPIVQFSLQIMLELVHQNILSIEQVVQLMCHNPAILFNIHKRGFIRQGYCADLVLVDRNALYCVTEDKIFSKCAWSPLTGTTFHSEISATFVNGNKIWQNGSFCNDTKGKRLMFDR